MKRKLLLVCVLLFFPPALYAVIVGSNESVSIQSHITFPAADADNSILGFAFMEHGFSFENSLTTCTFKSIYPASGAIDLKGGTLILDRDIVFQDATVFQHLGTIIGNGHTITIGSHADAFPSTLTILQDVNVIINNDLTLTGSVICRGICAFLGNGNEIFLGNDGILIVDSDSTLKFAQCVLFNVAGQNIQCADDSASIIFDTSSVTQFGDFSFSKGSFSILNSVDWTGPFEFLYDSSQSSTILAQSHLRLSEDIIFSVGRFVDNAVVEPLVFVDQTSVLSLDSATLNITAHGAQFTKGSVIILNSVTIDVNSTSTDTAFFVGNGILADDLTFILGASSSLNFATGLVIFDVVGADIFQAKSGSKLLRGVLSVFMFDQSRIYRNLIVNRLPGEVTLFAPGATLLFENSTLLLPESSFLLNGFSIDNSTNLLNGNQNIFLNSGTLELITLVAHVANDVSGNGVISQPIMLQDSNTLLDLNFNGRFDANIIMNGGTIFLENDISFGHETLISGSGNVLLANHSLFLGDLHLTFTSPLHWNGATGVIVLNADVALSNTWTFSGSCIISGNGNFLDLTGGGLVVEQGASLEFHNVTVQGISGNNIRCVDDSGLLILDNVRWIQDANFSFTHGAMIFEKTVDFQGAANFVYQSVKTSTIEAGSVIALNSLFTFSYDVSSPDLLEFTNDTSILSLNSATLHAAQQGLNLRHGTLQVQGNSLLSTDSAITLGDCFTGTNDFNVTVASNAQLEIAQGAFNYKNVNAASWNMQSTSILRTDGGAQLNLYQVMNLGAGSAVFGNNATLGNQANLIGSSSQEGVLNVVVLPPC